MASSSTRRAQPTSNAILTDLRRILAAPAIEGSLTEVTPYGTAVVPKDELAAIMNDCERLERVREAADKLANVLTIEGVLDDGDAFDLLLELEAELGTIGALNEGVASAK